MIQFYKFRDLGQLIGDTFIFFKKFGKNYFKNYFAINGVFLILMVVFFIFAFQEFFSQIFTSRVERNPTFFQDYFDENYPMLIVAGVVCFLIFLAISIVNYSFPVLYFKRIIHNQNAEITPDQMFADLKKALPKLFKFFLGLFFIILPVWLIFSVVNTFLSLILIGYLISFIVTPVMTNFVNFSLYDYLNTDRGYFETLSYSLRAQFGYNSGHLKSPFWKYWGSNFIMMMILYVVMIASTIIPIVIFQIAFISAPQIGSEGGREFFTPGITVFIFIFFGIILMLIFAMMNVLYINNGFMYYDHRTDLHRKMDLNEIDTIGKGEI